MELENWSFPSATASIAAYERENATVWRRELKWTGLLFDARAVLWFAALILFHAFGEISRTDFKIVGAVDRAAVSHGAWFRLFTAVTLHADVAHLAANVTIGIVFLGLAMGCFGVGNAFNSAGNPAYNNAVQYNGSSKGHLDIVSIGVKYRWDDPSPSAAPIVKKY